MRKSNHVSFGDVTYQPGGSCGPRFHPVYQLLVLHEGPSILRFEGVRVRLEEATMILTPPCQQTYTFCPDAPTRHSWCELRVDSVPKNLRDLIPQTPAPLAYTARMASLFDLAFARGPSLNRRLANENADAVPDPLPGFLDSIGLACLWEYVHSIRAAQGDPGPAFTSEERKPLPEPLRRARQLIESDFGMSLGLGDLAHAAGVTPQHVSKLFQKHLGLTPMNFLWQVRLERAHQLLIQTGFSISEIAFRCGFSTPYHFSKRYKAVYGQAPRHARNEAWGR